MKKQLLFTSCIWLLCQAETAAQPKDSITMVTERCAKVFMESKAAVGASIGIYIDGKVYTYNYGSVSKDKEQLPSVHTLYGIASITKTFTGLLLAKAVTEKKVKLDDDIRQYLDGNYPNLEYNGQPIKLYHLITHVSRLPMWLSDRAEKPGYSRADFYQDLHQVTIDTLPGIKFRYSNAAAQLLGYILEKVYGKSLEKLFEEKITGPLKMKDTHIVLTAREKKEAAKGYTNAGLRDTSEYNYMQGAGGLKSSVSDLLKYMAYHMNEQDPAVALSHKESWGFDMDNGNHYSCALNWQIITLADGRHRISQNGDMPNCSGVITLCPETKTGIVILTNSDNLDAVSKFAEDILKILAPDTFQ